MFEFLNKTQEEVKKSVVDQNNIVYSNLVNSLVQKEIQERTELVGKAVESLKTKSRELNNCRADSKLLDQEGKVIQEGFTQEQLNKRKKMVDTINNIEKALEEAITNANYENLKKVLGNLPKE